MVAKSTLILPGDEIGTRLAALSSENQAVHLIAHYYA
jgi:hypothetical protein